MSEAFGSIMKGLQEALEFERGNSDAFVTYYVSCDDGTKKRVRQHITPLKEYDKQRIRDIRSKTGLTQQLFAEVIGVSKKTVEAWEYGNNAPNGPARRLLALLENGDKIIA